MSDYMTEFVLKSFIYFLEELPNDPPLTKQGIIEIIKQKLKKIVNENKTRRI